MSQYIRYSRPLGTLTYSLDWILVRPFPPNRMRIQRAHEGANFRLASACQWKGLQARLNIYRLHFRKPIRSPARKNPSIQVNFVRILCRIRLLHLVCRTVFGFPFVKNIWKLVFPVVFDERLDTYVFEQLLRSLSMVKGIASPAD